MFSIGQTVGVRYLNRYRGVEHRTGVIVRVITAHWSKPLARYRVRLTDNTEVICTGVEIDAMTDPGQLGQSSTDVSGNL